MNLKILLFNNRIYGLTKGQYSPTSETGKVTKSTPLGSIDVPFNPVSLALGAEATFVARALDSDRTGLTETLAAAAEHRGTALVEILQNCPIFNDGAFDILRRPGAKERRLIPLRHGEPVRFGTHGEYGLIRDGSGGLATANVAEIDERALVKHDATAEDPSYAFALSRLSSQDLGHCVTGIFRSVSRPAYDDQARAQIAQATAAAPADLQDLLTGKDTWTVAG